MDENTQDSLPGLEKNSEKSSNGIPLAFKIGFLSIFGAILLGYLTVFVFIPMVTNIDAKNRINNSVIGEMQAVNTELTVFTGQKIENANTDQKALSQNGVATNPPGIVFGNGKTTDPQKKVVIYLDLSDQRSRDFLLINQMVLKRAVLSGEISVKIVFVPKGDPITIYSAEAVSESANTTPKATWDFMLSLVKFAASGPDLSNKELVAKIEELAKNNNVVDVDSEGILNGTFASWILSVGNDDILSKGYYTPLILVNGKTVDTSTVNVNDSTEFSNFLKNK